MKHLNDEIINELKTIFKDLKDPVTIKYFTQDVECHFCKDTRELIQEIVSISEGITMETYDFIKDKKTAEQYGIDKIPATLVMGGKDRGIRFYGIPSGYEFASFIEAIKMVSTSDTSLSDETLKFLKNLDKDVHLQVFVTPTCPYCPQAVIMAHQMAFVSDRVKADMVEATEFPELSQKYQVMGVPRTVINESEFQEGAAPEQTIVEKIKKAT